MDLMHSNQFLLATLVIIAFMAAVSITGYFSQKHRGPDNTHDFDTGEPKTAS